MIKAGDVYVLDYDQMFTAPEMIKIRPVVIVSPQTKDRSSGLAIVVPLSTTEPTRGMPKYVVPLANTYDWAHGKKIYAKCDMLNTISTMRLEHIRAYQKQMARGQNYVPVPHVTAEDLKAIRMGVAFAVDADKFISSELKREYANYLKRARDKLNAMMLRKRSY